MGAGKKPRAKSDYGLGLIEKQKARMSYGIPGRQFSNYVKKAIENKGSSSEMLVRSLESRLDNVALRAGYYVIGTVMKRLAPQFMILRLKCAKSKIIRWTF